MLSGCALHTPIVVDPKNWTLPLGVELTRKEVYYAQEAQKF